MKLNLNTIVNPVLQNLFIALSGR